MARKNIYAVGDQFFRTKEELKKHVQFILHSYSIGQSLQGENLNFMFELLKLHPNANEKIGCGLKGIQVVEHQWKLPAFEIEREDGSTTDFSYMKCIYPVSAERLFGEACRALIAPEIKAFKVNYFSLHSNALGQVKCPLTNELVTILESHVDHKAPETFEKILHDFILLREIDVNVVKLGGFGDNETLKTIPDEKLAQDFMEFHHQRAVLRVVSKQSNLRLPKR